MLTRVRTAFAWVHRRDSWVIEHWRWVVVIVWYSALSAAFMAVVVVGVNWPATSVAIDAQTEYVRFEATEGHELNWNVGGFELEACLTPHGVPQHLKLEDQAGLQVGAGVIASITKPEGSTDVDVDLLDSASAHAVGTECDGRNAAWLVNPDSTQAPLYGAHVRLRRTDPNAPARVFPIWGAVTLGQDPGAGQQELVIGGHASLHASNADRRNSMLYAWLQRELNYVPETLPLQRGDLVLPPLNRKDIAATRGFVRVPAKEPLEVGYYVKTDQVIVQRPGNATLELSLTLWDRFKNEPALSGTVAALIALFGLGKLAEDLGRSVRFALKH